MITIEKARLDLQMSSEGFATELYGRWDSLYPTMVEKVIDDVLSRYDREDEVIRLEAVTLDLGEIEEPDFYRQFPKRLAEKLDDFLTDCLKFRGKYPVEVIPVYTDKTEVLLFFLEYGFFPRGASGELNDLSVLLKEVIENNGTEFIRLLKGGGNLPAIRKRLAYQFADGELEMIVRAAKPSEATFIQVYVRYLIVSHGRLGHPEITAGDHRHVVWQVVLAYLLFDSGSFFSRKQMVGQTVRGLAAHFNLDFFYLLQLLTAGLKKFTEEWILIPELLAIFSDLQQEAVGKFPEIDVALDIVRSAKTLSAADCGILCRLLSQPASCRQVLAGLKEEEIICIVEWLIPAESPFIVGYARSLEHERERGLLEGKAGPEFRLLKWEFLFLVLLDSPVSSFQRSRFVMAVVHRLARHYNLDALVLLAFLCADAAELPVPLAEILKELYEMQISARFCNVLDETGKNDWKMSELSRLAGLLSHPLTARRFLQNIPEAQIFHLTEIIIPAQSAFIISYARSLDREKEKGMLEGRAGAEFRLLKWEFIFLVVLSVPVSAFSRKYFVRSVLWQLAAHYNLTAGQLLDYFFSGGTKSRLPEDLQQVILELWEEEKMQTSVQESGAEQYVGNIFTVLSKRREISEQMWDRAGIEFVVGLLQNYRNPEVSGFIRKWKRQIWSMLFRSVKHAELLCEKISATQGLWNYLVDEYGEETFVAALVEKHLDHTGWKECSPVMWCAALKQGDTGMVFWWLNNRPGTVRRMWQQCSSAEERQILEGIAGNVELQKLWLDRLGRFPVRQVWDILVELKNRFSFFPGEQVWLGWFIPYTGKRYINFSGKEILKSVWQKLTTVLSEKKCEEIIRHIKTQTVNNVFKILEMMVQEQKPDGGQSGKKTAESRKPDKWGREEVRFDIKNAGLVLLAPYFPMLFKHLGYVVDGNFKDTEQQVRAMFLLQYMLYERCEFQESELVLNKLLTGCEMEQAVPREVELTEEEKNLSLSMLNGAMKNWDKLKHTSLQGFRDSFLIRGGILQETGDFWQLGVEVRGFDVLLDSLPWSYSPVKFPWMKKPVYVNWRN